MFPCITFFVTSANAFADQPDANIVGEETAVLSNAPLVPPPIKRDHPTKVRVDIEVRESTVPPQS